VLLSHHFLFLQQLSLAIAAATVFLHSIIRNLVATFNSSPLVQFLSNKSAAEPEKKKTERQSTSRNKHKGGTSWRTYRDRVKRTEKKEHSKGNRNRTTEKERARSMKEA